MDVGTTNGWRLDDVVTAQEILARIDQEHPLCPVDPNYVGEVAKRWAFADGGGEIGVIASVTQAFCHECSRLRLSTDGRLYTCLFATEGYDLRSPLRGGESDSLLRERVVALWSRRGDRYSQLRVITSYSIHYTKLYETTNNMQAGPNINQEIYPGWRNPDAFVVVSDAYPTVSYNFV